MSIFVVVSDHSDHSEDHETNHDVSFNDDGVDLDTTVVDDKNSSSFVTFDCTEPHCIMQFRREDRLRTHLLLGSHKTVIPHYRLLDKAAIIYKQSLENDIPKQVPALSTVGITERKSAILTVDLKEGWAIFRPRARIGFTIAQRSYLQQKYDEGEKGGAKWNASAVAEASSFFINRTFFS